jgi:hypothetical protein
MSRRSRQILLIHLRLHLNHCTAFNFDADVDSELPSLQDQLLVDLAEDEYDSEGGIAALKPFLNHCTTFVFELESYDAAINANEGYGNGLGFLGPGLGIKGVPWYYDYEGLIEGFQL